MNANTFLVSVVFAPRIWVMCKSEQKIGFCEILTFVFVVCNKFSYSEKIKLAVWYKYDDKT